MIMSKDQHARLNSLLDELNAIRWEARPTATNTEDCFNTVAELDTIEIRNLVVFCIAELDARNQGGELDRIDRELRKRL